MEINNIQPSVANYFARLGGRPAIEQLDLTRNKIAALLDGFADSDWAKSYAEGKWSAAQIVCHLTDVELVFGYRLRQALAEEAHVVQPFDQDLWATFYDRLDGATALATFKALRAWNLTLFHSLTPAELAKTYTHPERGVETIEFLASMFAGHDLNHLEQLETIACSLI